MRIKLKCKDSNFIHAKLCQVKYDKSATEKEKNQHQKQTLLDGKNENSENR